MYCFYIGRCVACGENSHFLRYRVVPSCYRRNFPAHLKVQDFRGVLYALVAPYGA